MKKRLLSFCLTMLLFGVFLGGCSFSTAPKKTEEGKKYTLTVIGGSGSGEYDAYSSATIDAVVPSGMEFVKWVSSDSEISDYTPMTITVTSNMTISAVFQEIEDVDPPVDPPIDPPVNPPVDPPVIPPIEEMTGLTVWAADNATQIKKNAPVPANPQGQVYFAAAANERESAQIILTSQTDINNIQLEILSDLTGDGGTISKSNIQIFNQWYVNVTTNWSATNDQPKSWFPSGTSKTELGTGWYPDALVPYNVASLYSENVLKTANGNNQGLWLTFTVPTDAKAGRYTSTLRISSGGKGKDIPIVADIFDFALPSVTNNKTMFIISPNASQNKLASDNASTIDGIAAGHAGSEFYKLYYEFLASRRISGGQIPHGYWTKSEIPDYVEALKLYATDDRIATYNLFCNYELVSCNGMSNLAVLQINDMMSGNYNIAGMKSLFTAMANASTDSLNLFDKAEIYFPQNDEPNNNDGYAQAILSENAVRQSIAYAIANCNLTSKPKVKAAMQKLIPIVTVHPVDYVMGTSSSNKLLNKTYTDGSNATITVTSNTLSGYCTLFPFFQSNLNGTTLNSYINDSSKKVWWYGCVQPVAPYATFALNAPIAAERVNRWQQFDKGVQGELYWSINTYKAYIAGVSAFRDPWTTPGNHEGSNGEGQLVYPANKRYSGKVKICSSIRLESYAESCDDYDYLCYAQALINKLTGSNKTAKQNELKSITSALYTNPATNTINTTLLKTARTNLANLIITLQ